MKHKMVDVVEDGVAKKISLWEATGEDGYWNEQKYGPNSEWSSDDTEDQVAWNKFKIQMKTVSTIVYGNQDNNSPLYMKSVILGRLIGQFRLSWLPEGIATRFQDERMDDSLGRKVKGRWRTYHDIGYRNSGLILAKQLLSSLPGVTMDAFAGYKGKKGEAISDLDKENMRKNFAGMAFTMGVAISMVLAKSLILPDKEEKRRRRAAGKSVHVPEYMMAINLMTRNYQDLMLYSSPAVFDTILGNVIPAMATVTEFTKLVGAVGHLMGDDKKKYTKLRKQFTKSLPILTNINKIETFTKKDVGLVK